MKKLDEIFDCASRGDFSRAVDLASDAVKQLADGEMANLKILDGKTPALWPMATGARARATGVVATLRAAVDHALYKCLGADRFDADE